MRKLKVNFSMCTDCGNCEKILPKFRSVYGGILMVNLNGSDTEARRAAAESVPRGCPVGAISFR